MKIVIEEETVINQEEAEAKEVDIEVIEAEEAEVVEEAIKTIEAEEVAIEMTEPIMRDVLKETSKRMMVNGRMSLERKLITKSLSRYLRNSKKCSQKMKNGQRYEKERELFIDKIFVFNLRF